MKLSDFSIQFNIQPNTKEVGVDEYLIYFLIEVDTIVYVGKSSEGALFGRLRSHQTDKVFDSYFAVNGIATEEEALELEKGFISLLRPKYNKAEARVNLRAIQRVIQYVTTPKAFTAYKNRQTLDVVSELERQKSKLRAYRSKLNRGKGNAETNQAGAAMAEAEIHRLQGILAGQRTT